MQRPALIFENSPFFFLLCVLAGVCYAYVLYQKTGPWGALANKLLFVLRALVVTVVSALLVSPILKQVQNIIEQPTLVFAVDNSASIAEVVDSTQLDVLNDRFKQLASDVNNKYDVEYRDLLGEKSKKFPEDITYEAQSTDINKLINDIRLDYEGRNLGGVILISDGIYNHGISPTFSDYNFNIHTVGIGDTIPKSDLSVASLLYNKISYQGNKFPLIAQVSHRGYAGQNAQVTVINNGKVLQQQTIKLGADNQIKEVRFTVEAAEKGYQRYQVKIERKEGEFTYVNNLQQAYIEVIEGKEQIALIAPAPHPDIKALKSAIESNANYTIDQFILSLNDDVNRLSATNKKYDLVIYHQLPDSKGLGDRFLQKFRDEKTSSLVIYGAQTNMRKFNQFNKLLSIDAIPNESDKITAVFNQGFSRFKLSDKLQQSLTAFPPIVVPFGRISLAAEADVLLYQQVGSIGTTRPLVAVGNQGEAKQGVIMADGLWLWKLTDYANNGNNESFNELITKLVQYLSSKEDKRKFRAYPVKNEFLTNEKVIFDTEVYNDLYERVYGNKIDLAITDADGKRSNYSYVTNENNTRYTITGLPEGVFKYTASTQLEGRTERVNGEFIVKELQMESVNLTADFNLLRTISNKSGSQFYHADELERLKQELSVRQAQGTIHTTESYLPFIHLKWIFFLLLVLLSTEWFIRKYNGSY